MAYSRNRSRYKVKSLTTTTVKRANGTTLQSTAYPTVAINESMSDFVIQGFGKMQSTGFQHVYDIPPRHTLADAARSGLQSKYRDLKRFIPPVQNLVYTCSTDEEPIGDTKFRYLPGVDFLLVHGSVTQHLNNLWAGAYTDPSVTLPDWQKLLSEEKVKVLGRVSSPNYSFGEPIGEIRSTLSLVTQPLRTVDRLTRSFSRKLENRNFRTNRAQARAIATAYAEISWAAAPLVRTVDSACQALADYFYKKTKPAFQRATSSKIVQGGSGTFKDNTYNFPYAGGFSARSWKCTGVCRKTVVYEVSAGVRYIHEDAGSIGTLLGLRGRDIPLTLWQLMPLSFMVDRLYNVSGCLKAASNFLTTNVKFTGGWASTRRTTTTTRLLTNLRENPDWTNNPVIPSQTNPWVHTDFVYTRDQWAPGLGDIYPPASASGLVSNLRRCADLAAVSVLRLTPEGDIRRRR